MAIELKIQALEQIVHVDPGNRGLGKIWKDLDSFAADRHHLYQLVGACEALYSSKKITGFFIFAAKTIETDGPPGALAIAHALWKLGKEVTLLIDHDGGANLLRDGVELFATHSAGEAVLPRVIRCPDRLGVEDYQVYLNGLLEEHSVDTIVSIERSCRTSNGCYHSMRGIDLTQYTAPLDELFLAAQSGAVRRITIGIGDGGNEVGMNNLSSYIQKHVPHGDKIASAIGCDHLISAGVSNWGGYAVAAGLFLLQRDRTGSADEEMLPNTKSEGKIMELMVNKYGIVDGTTGKAEMMVDGLPFDTYHCRMIDSIRYAALHPQLK